MRFCALLLLAFALLGIEHAQAQERGVWLGTSITDETVTSVTTYKGVMLLGTEAGLYTGIKGFLDGGSGYPDYDWGLRPLRSIHTSAEHEQFLKHTSSAAVLKDGTVYALSDSGLFYIQTTIWSTGIPEEIWKKDETFSEGGLQKLSGHGDAIFLTVSGRLYRKTIDTEWTKIPFYTDWDMSSPESLRGPEQIITDYKVCGPDIVVTIESLFDGPGRWSDIYVTSDTGKKWIAGPVHLSNVVDFTAYRTFWNDSFPDLAYCQNDSYNDSTKVTFQEDWGALTHDKGEVQGPVVTQFKGLSNAIAVTAVSKSDVPQFYLSLSEGVYSCGADYVWQKDKSAPEDLKSIYVGPNDADDLIAFSERALYYNTFMHGVGIVNPKSSQEKLLQLSNSGQALNFQSALKGIYALYNLQGRVLLSGTLNKGVTSVPVHSLSKGTYVASLIYEGVRYSQKVSIQ